MSKYLAISKSQLVLPTMEKPEKGFGVITSPAFMSAYLKEVERYNQHLSGLPRYESDIELVPNQYYTEGVDFKWKPWFDKFNDGKRAVPLSAVAQPGKEVEGEKKLCPDCHGNGFTTNGEMRLEDDYREYDCDTCDSSGYLPAPDLTNDPFVQKHLKNIKSKIKYYKDAHQLAGELINKHIKPLFDSLGAASIKYFLEKGTINGGFNEALTNMIVEALPEPAVHLPSPGKQEPKRMSAFEHAILNQVDPEEAKKYKPYTKEEELEQRENHLKEQASKIRVNTGKQEGERAYPGDRFGHHDNWKYCPGCGQDWDEDMGFDSMGCTCGYIRQQPPAMQDIAEGKEPDDFYSVGDEAKREAILEFNYNSFIGTRFTCEDWIPWEEVSKDQKDLIYACMGDYVASLPPHAESYSREFVEGAIEWLYNSGYRRNDGYWWNVSPTGTPIELTTPDLLTSYIKSLNK